MLAFAERLGHYPLGCEFEHTVGEVLMLYRGSQLRSLALGLAIALLATGCGGGGGTTSTVNSVPPPAGQTSALTIAGQPAGSAVVGQAYSFQPTTSGADGTLTYSAANLPSWLAINTSTGMLTGTPTAGDVGNDSAITVSVTDGTQSASLPAFSIAVAQTASGSAVVSWTAPTENTDGTQIANLASYKILYGRSASSLDQSVSIANPTVTQYQIDNLSPGTWYFAVVSVNSAGSQSAPSNVTSTAI
jgi:Putative Ig domain